jgi:glycyl-tRNA synthetase alpha chain
MEITQFTYFQQVGGLDCKPVTGEITYGLERIAMYLQGVESVFDLLWTDGPLGRVSLRRCVSPERSGNVHLQLSSTPTPTALFVWFDTCESESKRLIELGLPLPAYEMT